MGWMIDAKLLDCKIGSWICFWSPFDHIPSRWTNDLIKVTQEALLYQKTVYRSFHLKNLLFYHHLCQGVRRRVGVCRGPGGEEISSNHCGGRPPHQVIPPPHQHHRHRLCTIMINTRRRCAVGRSVTTSCHVCWYRRPPRWDTDFLSYVLCILEDGDDGDDIGDRPGGMSSSCW